MYVLASLSGASTIRRYTSSVPSGSEILPQGVAWFLVPPNVRHETHYMQDGVAVAYTEAQRLNLAVRPAYPATWVVPECAWRDDRTLDYIKATKNAEINAARLTANRSTFTFAGKAIACDELSRSDIDGAHGIILMTQALPPGWPGGWKAVDNTYVAIPDVATWGAFYAAMVSQGMSNFAKSQVLKAQLAAATTVAEVEAIQW